MNFIRIADASISTYGNELLIYNNSSGDTYLMNVDIPEKLVKLCLKENIINTDALIKKIYMEFNLKFERIILEAFLEKLSQIDILKPVHL